MEDFVFEGVSRIRKLDPSFSKFLDPLLAAHSS